MDSDLLPLLAYLKDYNLSCDFLSVVKMSFLFVVTVGSLDNVVAHYIIIFIFPKHCIFTHRYVKLYYFVMLLSVTTREFSSMHT